MCKPESVELPCDPCDLVTRFSLSVFLKNLTIAHPFLLLYFCLVLFTLCSTAFVVRQARHPQACPSVMGCACRRSEIK